MEQTEREPSIEGKAAESSQKAEGNGSVSLKDLKSLLADLVGHQVSLSFTLHEEGDLRDSQGILKEFDDWGYRYDYYLNRHACTLHSIVDYGEPQKR